MKKCECFEHGAEWDIITTHTPTCYNGVLSNRKELVTLIKALTRGIEVWASDEDGVHPDCWEAYKEAKQRLFQKVSDKSER